MIDSQAVKNTCNASIESKGFCFYKCIAVAKVVKTRFELSAKPSKAEKEAKGLSGFVPVAARWVIERSNAWVERCKSLVKNFDRTLKRSNAKLKLCFIRLMVKRLAATPDT